MRSSRSGVTHAPYQRVLDAMTADGAGLVIAGHTHGGQLCVPGWGALVTNCDLDTRRAKGLSRWWPGAGVDTVLRGTRPGRHTCRCPRDSGTSPMAPVRFACRPEATLLTLAAPPTDLPWWRIGRASARPRAGHGRRGDIDWAQVCRSAILCPCCRNDPRAPRYGRGPRGVAQLGSALRSGRRGRRFKSCHPDQLAFGL
jgi:hypothetical protein